MKKLREMGLNCGLRDIYKGKYRSAYDIVTNKSYLTYFSKILYLRFK